MHPVVESRVLTSQSRQKSAHDQHAKGRSFNLEEAVYVRNYANGPKWLPGVITALRGPLSYDVTLSDDRVIHRHVDQVRSRFGSHRPDAELPDDWLPDPTPPTHATTIILALFLPPPQREHSPPSGTLLRIPDGGCSKSPETL